MTGYPALAADAPETGPAPGAIAADQAPVSMATEYPSPTVGWMTVAILFLLYILSLTDRYIMALMVDPIKRSLSLSDLQISLLQGPAFAILFALCAVPVGIALDRIGRRWVLWASVTVWSLAAASCGLAGSFAALFVSRAAVGAGEAGFGTGSYSVIGDSFPPQRVSLAMSIFVMGGVMGAGIVFLVGGPIVSAIMKAGPVAWPVFGLLEPWQRVFLITGAPGLLMALMVFLFREPPRRRELAAGGGYGEAFAFVRANGRLFVSIFAGFGLAYAITIGFQLWLPSYLARVHHWAPTRIGLSVGVAQMLAAATLPGHGWIIDRLYRGGRRDAHLFWCTIAGLAAAPFGIAAFLVASPQATIVLYGLFTACILSTASTGPAVTQVVTPPHLRGRISAMYVFATGLLAMAGGPALVGLITDKLLGDEMKVGTSLMLMVVIVLLPAVALFAYGRGALGRVVQPAA